MGGGAGKIRLSVEAGGDDGETDKDTSKGTGSTIELAQQTVYQYFKQLQAEQLKALKKHYEDEIEAHEREINRHTESINRLKRRRSEISKAASNADIDSMVGLRIDS